MSAIDFGLLPLRRYAVFRGRSTRTELVCFWLLLAFVNVVLTMLTFPVRAGGGDWLVPLVSLLLLCPAAALAVRRLHDQGRAGWWAFVAFPPFAMKLWLQYPLSSARDPFAAVARAAELPTWAVLANGLSALALLVLMLWPGEEGPNRYGADPRDDPDRPNL